MPHHDDWLGLNYTANSQTEQLESRLLIEKLSGNQYKSLSAMNNEDFTKQNGGE